ncbi:hypothetical protein [Ralstonia pseudosolanacearum]
MLYRPYAITTQYFDDTGKKYGIYLSNAGLGPAIIKDMLVTVGGRTYSGLGASIWPQFGADMGIGGMICLRSAWPPQDSVMKVGEEVPLFTVSDFAAAGCMLQMFQLLANNDIVVEVRYASLYGDEFSSINHMRLNNSDAIHLAEQLKRLSSIVEPSRR